MSISQEPTDEQKAFASHPCEAFVIACPGAGKTHTILDRVEIQLKALPPRRGIAVLSFTQSAVEEFSERCRKRGLHKIAEHPCFLGTFDSFIRHFLVMPGGINVSSGPIRPTIVDSWDSIGIKVRIKDEKGAGISLDRFSPDDNSISLDQIGHLGERAHVAANKAKYETVAAKKRAKLRNAGFLSSADARTEALARIKKAELGKALGRALAARFAEIIVDEGQDCNPQDIEVLRWLRQHGIRVTLLADLDQSIYGFRHGTPVNLSEFAEEYGISDRLKLTGNFRCSPPICALAASLRSKDHSDSDLSLGSSKTIQNAIKILTYDGQDAPSSVGKRFEELIVAQDIERNKAAILAHEWKSARKAAGNTCDSTENGSSRLEMVARAVCAYRDHATTPRQRLIALQSIERLILKLECKCNEDEPLASAIERRRIDQRILRRKAISLITALPYPIGNNNADHNEWVKSLQATVSRLHFDLPAGVTPAKCFHNQSHTKWAQTLHAHESTPIAASSIHEVKGREFGAVCVVLPNRGDRTEELISAWESRSDYEPKRVIYVGVTRAEKFVVIVLPRQYESRLIALLSASKVPFDLPEILAFEKLKISKTKRGTKCNIAQMDLFTDAR